MLCLMVQMSQHMYIQSNPVRAVDAERGLGGAWLVIQPPIWSPKQKKKNDNIFYHSSAHKSPAVTCSLCNLLYIYFWHGAIFYFIFSPIRRVYLSGGSLELFGDDDRSYLQKRRAVEETFGELVRRDSFPIINNNPPHFLFRLSDVCISFVFFNWRSLIKPSP